MIFKHIIAITALLASASVNAANLSKHDTCANAPKYIHRIGADLRGGYVASSANHVAQDYDETGATKLHSAMSAHLKYSFKYSDVTRTGRLYPDTYQGIGLSYTTFFNNARTGSPINLYLFQGAPIIKLSPRLSLDYEWNFGASFGWKKYNPDLPPVNIIVGSKVNAYINLGFMLNYRMSRQWSLTAGIDMTHYSNGNTSWPNPGVNSLGARVGMTYTFDDRTKSSLDTPPPAVDPVKPHISYDLVVYGAARKRMIMLHDSPELLPGRFGIAGINFSPMYNFNRFFRAGMSVDIQYDESSDLASYWVDGTYGDDIKFRRPPFFHQVSAGLSLRGELVMPIFSINAGVGYNILGNPDTRNLYQVLALKIHMTRSLFLHIGYQLNKFENPNNLMIGIGYRFHDLR